MPPKAVDPDAVLPLQEWIRLLTGQGVPMRVAMAFAATAYKENNTRGKLAAMGSDKIKEQVDDKEARKVLLNAVKGVSTGQSPQKKRRRDDGLRPGGPPPDVPESFDFNEIRDPEELLGVSVTVNRAPVKTAWAYCVARRLGFDVAEALSLAHVYVHIGSLKHALALGNILNSTETREAEEEIRELPGEEYYHVPGTKPREEEHKVGSSQPWVGLLRSKIPVIERPDGTWRAIQKGVAVEPSVAYLYITRALKTYTPHVLGAMQLVAESYSPEELDAVGLRLYNEFKPDVVNWGQRGSVSVATILDQMNGPVGSGSEPGEDGDKRGENADDGENEKEQGNDDEKNDGPKVDKKRKPEETNNSSDPVLDAESDSTPHKKPKPMSVEEYEAMLDAEYDDALFQF